LRPQIKLSVLVVASLIALSGCARNEMPGFEQYESDLSGTLNGSGASSMAAGMEAWIAFFQIRHPEVTINYDPTGSGTGRTQFQEGATVFTGSDSYWKDEELVGRFPSCSPGTLPWEFPIWIAPIAIIFNLDGISSLNLSPRAIAGIFSGKITNWQDPEITKDNPRVELPDLAITAVHRSDKSGTTGNFTDYLAKTAPEIWDAGKTEEWPSKYRGEGAQGTSGVVSAVSGGRGTIGYADASRAGGFGIAAIKVGKTFVNYSPAAAAKVLEASKVIDGRGQTNLAYEIARDTEVAGVYPIVLVSYLMGCNDYKDDSLVPLIKEWANFLISEEGQSIAAQAAGSAPIPDSLRDKAKLIIDGIR